MLCRGKTSNSILDWLSRVSQRKLKLGFVKRLSSRIVRTGKQVCGNVATSEFFEGEQMSITTLSSRQFNQDASKAKLAAHLGPVIITDRGKPAHVLLSYVQYQKLCQLQTNILDLLTLQAEESQFDPNFDFDALLQRSRETPRAADLYVNASDAPQDCAP
jgi:PHD/YefM family antitoxin component YafN of YafNO toxin-antitoxin module